MSKSHTFLVEIGTEELPPKSLLALSDAFKTQILEGIAAAHLGSDLEFAHFATPRRLAIKIKGVLIKQLDQQLKKTGPAVQAAYDKDGNPTPACLGFAKTNNIPVDQLIVEAGRVTCIVEKAGEKAVDLLPQIVEQALAKLPIAKRMRWGNQPHEFVRPVQWLVMMLGSDLIPCCLFGINAGNQTYGHRFMHPAAITLKHPDDYASSLENIGFVLADFENRRASIVTQSLMLAKTIDADVILDPALLEEVTGLVEWPAALMANFDPEFLEVPKEALIAVMRDHQRTFPIVDAQGQLLPHFIAISNISSLDPAVVIHGNERVMRARFSDAAFFYKADKAKPFKDFINDLKPVIFQNELGSLYNKAHRLSALSQLIAHHCHLNEVFASRAGLLAKVDLMTAMVGEFPELQGIMGRYYAELSGEGTSIAIAIDEHYQPRFAGDAVPATLLGASVALADKLDTLIGIFGINQIPTGDKDPFGLRRAAIGILRILIEKTLPLDLEVLLTKAASLYAEQGITFKNTTVVTQTFDFIYERLRSWYNDKNIPADIFAAVLAKRPTSLIDFDRRIKAVYYFKQLPEATALAAANKRVSNILKQAVTIPATLEQGFLVEPEEAQLARELTLQHKSLQPLLLEGDYTGALTQLASLRAPIDGFFDKVMVMAEDPTLRQNRLALLAALRNLFLEVADISLLQA